MFLIPYFLVLIIIELSLIVYVMLFQNKTTGIIKPKTVKREKPETFNGFYVDR